MVNTKLPESKLSREDREVLAQRLVSYIKETKGIQVGWDSMGIRYNGVRSHIAGYYFTTPFTLDMPVREAVKEFNQLLGEF